MTTYNETGTGRDGSAYYLSQFMQDWRTSSAMEFYVYSRTTSDLLERMGHERDFPPTDVECSHCCDWFAIADGEISALPNSTGSQYYGSYTQRAEHERVEDGHAVWMCTDCEPQFVYCDDCGFRCHEDDMVSVTWSTSVCESCREDNYGWCDDHDSYYRDEDGCSDCTEESSDLINDYSYRPSPTFFLGSLGARKTSYSEPVHTSVTGFELEMEAVNCSVSDGAELANEIYEEECYLKHDGSLSDGFEMVSHPLSREYIDSIFNFDGLKKLSELGMRSAQTRTCGLHVHINRGFFDGRESSFYRFLSVFHNNSEQWRKLAGRSTSTYSRWTDEEAENMVNYTKSFRTSSGLTRNRVINNDRYVAINLQPSQTVELRFFKGTLRPLTMKARVEAVHAVAEFSVATRNNINIKASSDWDKFRQFAETNGYKAFSTYATEKGV
jgi:hypothetical protein